MACIKSQAKPTEQKWARGCHRSDFLFKFLGHNSGSLTYSPHHSWWSLELEYSALSRTNVWQGPHTGALAVSLELWDQLPWSCRPRPASRNPTNPLEMWPPVETIKFKYWYHCFSAVLPWTRCLTSLNLNISIWIESGGSDTKVTKMLV